MKLGLLILLFGFTYLSLSAPQQSTYKRKLPADKFILEDVGSGVNDLFTPSIHERAAGDEDVSFFAFLSRDKRRDRIRKSLQNRRVLILSSRDSDSKVKVLVAIGYIGTKQQIQNVENSFRDDIRFTVLCMDDMTYRLEDKVPDLVYEYEYEYREMGYFKMDDSIGKSREEAIVSLQLKPYNHKTWKTIDDEERKGYISVIRDYYTEVGANLQVLEVEDAHDKNNLEKKWREVFPLVIGNS